MITVYSVIQRSVRTGSIELLVRTTMLEKAHSIMAMSPGAALSTLEVVETQHEYENWLTRKLECRALNERVKAGTEARR